jgi:hypothetical protein
VHERKAVASTLQHWLDPGNDITELAGANKKAPLAKRLGGTVLLQIMPTKSRAWQHLVRLPPHD